MLKKLEMIFPILFKAYNISLFQLFLLCDTDKGIEVSVLGSEKVITKTEH